MYEVVVLICSHGEDIKVYFYFGLVCMLMYVRALINNGSPLVSMPLLCMSSVCMDFRIHSLLLILLLLTRVR